MGHKKVLWLQSCQTLQKSAPLPGSDAYDIS